MDKPDCQRISSLMDAAIDGELDLLTQMSFDAHLAACESCAAAQARRLVLVHRLRGEAERFTAPAAMRERLLAALPADAPSPAKRSGRRWLAGGAWAGSAAALAASLALVIGTPAPPDPVDRDLVAAHVRSLMPDHLMDVPSSDQHTVKPWFNGRLALSPPVPDLAQDGFPLLGGRLDYVDDHTAAALIYRHHKHIINLFIWASPGTSDSPPHRADRNGYTLLEWTGGGIAFAAVSDLNRPELETFQRLWWSKAQPAAKEPSP